MTQRHPKPSQITIPQFIMANESEILVDELRGSLDDNSDDIVSWWNDIVTVKLESRSEDSIRQIWQSFWQYECDRKVDIEGGNYTYTIKDTLLNKALRNSPPPTREMLDEFKRKLPTFQRSRKLYDIVLKDTDEKWNEFEDEWKTMKQQNSSEEIEGILKIRHSNEEHTILGIAVKNKNVPFEVIDMLLKECRETLSLPGKNGTIPLYDAFIYHKKNPDIIKALIPTPKDVDNYKSLEDEKWNPFGLDSSCLLHSAVQYRSLEHTFDALVQVCPPDTYKTQNKKERYPFQTGERNK